MNEYYTLNMLCENCGHKFTKNFPKGATVMSFHECPYCGCREAKKTGKPEDLDYHKIDNKTL